MNKKFLLTLPLAVSLLALTACWEENSSAQAEAGTVTEQQQTQSIDTANDAQLADGSAAAAAVPQEGISGIYCNKTATHRTELVALESPAEGKLTFSFSKWNNANGHKCGTIELEGMKTTDGQAWSVSKVDPYMESAVCVLTVKTENDAVTITGSGDCIQMCGAGETIDTITYPLSSKIEKPATQAEITGLYESAPVCPQ